MSDVRFGWIGETRRTALRSLLAAEVSHWSSDWWIQHAAAEVDVRSSDRWSATEKKAISWVSYADAGVLALYWRHMDVSAVGCHLAGTVRGEDAALAQRIGEDALQDLAKRVYRRAEGAGAERWKQERLPAYVASPHLGAYLVTFTLGGLAMELAIDRQLVDRLTPPTYTGNTRLVSRQDALGQARVSVTAVMDFGQVNLTHLPDLRVGEVLVGDRGLDEALQVIVNGKGAVAIGYMKRLGAQRAVVLDGITLQEQHKS
ncbi:hypothetical protein [Dyella tabacisoli]|uniref:Flagellar motor switch protein FliN-like C-terminal domain-containing protein n=1 Tax=Dyella tabacisoli TaxID=2282381 RepID=A0A369UKY9_9GAMM|nr:hypothetical protein [Dyella tabacisoli]RDD81432.1 hypothetical protein DVJ77_12020 [Dyella tabacisoli]